MANRLIRYDAALLRHFLADGFRGPGDVLLLAIVAMAGLFWVRQQVLALPPDAVWLSAVSEKLPANSDDTVAPGGLAVSSAVTASVVVPGVRRGARPSPWSYSALTAAVSDASPSFASAKSIPVFGSE